MPLPFSGAAFPLAGSDIDAAAARLRCPRASIVAVLTVETGGVGGFLKDGSGRPRILCEARKFGDATAHKWTASHPLISSRVNNWKLYRGGAAEYGRLADMVALDRTAALRSTSWGLFQVMGFNHGLCGYGDVEGFVRAMAEGEGAHLQAFVAYVERCGLAQSLRDQDWPHFGYGFNGPLYAVNRYDTKLEAAFSLAMGVRPVMLRIGCTGLAVEALQRALTAQGYPVAVDGGYGRVTELAVRRFQSMHGLEADGVAGPATMRTLGI